MRTHIKPKKGAFSRQCSTKKRRSKPRFIVTSLSKEEYDARSLYENEYCARGDMENRIKKKQLILFADVLIQTLRPVELSGTNMAKAQCETI